MMALLITFHAPHYTISNLLLLGGVVVALQIDEAGTVLGSTSIRLNLAKG
jgi:hypothetical protein